MPFHIFFSVTVLMLAWVIKMLIKILLSKLNKNGKCIFWAIIQKYYYEVQVLGTENPLEVCLKTVCLHYTMTN